MQIATAIKHLQKEAEFLGMPLLETLQDIKQHGRMLYSESTMEAFVVIATAIKHLQKEAEFLCMPLLETLQDIKQHGRMLYSESTKEAFVVFMQQGQALFAPVDE